MRELMLKKQVDKESVIFANTGIVKGFTFQPPVCNKFHDLLMMT